MKLILVLTAAAVAAATLTATAPAHLPGAAYCTARQPAKMELRCATRDHWHALSTIRWLRNHPYAGTVLVMQKARGGERSFAAVVRTRVATPERRTVTRNHRWLLRESAARIAEARARLNPWPPHHALWLCIHGDRRYRSDGGGEAGSWSDPNSGGNGHYGGLQMHPGWGHGTSYYASNDSQFVQEWAAERGYRASGYSRAWLAGQWGQTIAPCWGYA